MKKLKNESGSALSFAIFLLILVSIVMISFSTQVGNQVKSTMNLNKDIQEKYDEESKIEENLANFIGTIKFTEKTERWTTNDSNPIEKEYKYYELQYNQSNVTNIENIYISSSKYNRDIVIGENLIIDADISLENNNPNSIYKPHGDISNTINFNIIFGTSSNKLTKIKVKIYNIFNKDNYKISYDILSLRNK